MKFTIENKRKMELRELDYDYRGPTKNVINSSVKKFDYRTKLGENAAMNNIYASHTKTINWVQ